jgi:plasmid stabilization system protein ParE
MGVRLTIVNQRPGCVEIPWVRFLLGDMAGDVVDDRERRVVLPESLLVCDRLDLLSDDVLAEVRRQGTVGLLHISQQWYRDPLDAYRSFAFVWRTHHHSALAGGPVLQLPLPPAALEAVTAEPRPEALRPLAGRRHTWSFAGQLKATRVAMVRAFRRVEGGVEHVTGTQDDAARQLDGPAYLEMLAESVFVPCAMGNVHMESFRAYEALEVGAVPVLERRPWLDYHRALLGDHPIPTVRSWSDAPRLVRRLQADPDELAALQSRLVGWWTAKKRELAAAARGSVEDALASPGDGPALGRLPSRRRGLVEMLRHHNAAALAQRARLTTRRLRSHGSIRKRSSR